MSVGPYKSSGPHGKECTPRLNGGEILCLRSLLFTAVLTLTFGIAMQAQEISSTLYDRMGGAISGARSCS